MIILKIIPNMKISSYYSIIIGKIDENNPFYWLSTQNEPIYYGSILKVDLALILPDALSTL